MTRPSVRASETRCSWAAGSVPGQIDDLVEEHGAGEDVETDEMVGGHPGSRRSLIGHHEDLRPPPGR